MVTFAVMPGYSKHSPDVKMFGNRDSFPMVFINKGHIIDLDFMSV